MFNSFLQYSIGLFKQLAFRTLTLLFFQFCLNNSLYSQSCSLFQYSVNDGLPSSETHTLFQDSKGFIWIGTDRGVSRYNGYEFTTYTTKDGLPNNFIFKVFEDRQGKIWFCSLNGLLSYFDHDTIIAHKANKELSKLPIQESYISSIYIDSNNIIWMGRADSKIAFAKIHPDGTVEEERLSKFEDVYKLLFIKKIDNTPKGYIYGIKRIKEANRSNLSAVLINKQDEFSSCDNLIKSNLMRFSVIFNYGYNDEYVRFTGSSINLNDENLSTSIKRHPFRLYKGWRTRSSSYWGAKERVSGGVYLFSDNNNDIPIDHVLDGLTVTCVLEDIEGGFWFSTLEKGVFYRPNNIIKTLDFSRFKKKIVGITSLDDKIYVGLKNGELYKGHYDNLNDWTLIENFFYLRSVSNIPRVNKVVLCAGLSFDNSKSNVQKLLESQNKWNSYGFNGFIDEFIISTGKSIANFNGTDKLSSFGSSLLFTIENEDIQTQKIIRYKNTGRINKISYDDKGKLWLGTWKGVYFLENDSIYKFRHPSLNETRVNELFISDSLSIFSTLGQGVVILQDSIVELINEDKGLISDFCNVTVYDSNVLWIGTNNGISKITFDSGNIKSYDIENFTEKEGLVSNEVSQISLIKEKIFVSTKEGVSYFDRDYKRILNPPPSINISNFTSNESLISIDSNIRLNYNENNVSIEFFGLSFKSRKDITYEYRLSNIDSTWNSGIERKVHYPKLPPGEYTFEVAAINSDDVRSLNTASLNFSISSPFWNTLSFQIGSMLVIILIVYLLINYRVKIEKSQLQLKEQYVESELKALRAQMNPHFMFNALSSIQLLVLKNKKQDAISNIGKLAKLMRNILQNSKTPFITLSEEISTLESYIELERLRFDNQFDFSIDISSDSLKTMRIPSMIIQPFIENAIWHGIMKKKSGKGKIEISFSLENDYLVCVIVDNGIGRLAASKIDIPLMKNKSSMGIEITKNRLMLLNSTKRDYSGIKISDLKDHSGKVTGTKVRIEFPLKHTKSII